MDIDFLSPEFIAFADEVKKLYVKKGKMVSDFKVVWMKHKAAIEALEGKVDELKVKMLGGSLATAETLPPGPGGGVGEPVK